MWDKYIFFLFCALIRLQNPHKMEVELKHMFIESVEKC